MFDYSDILVYGKDSTKRIVSVEVKNNETIIFQEMEDGSIVETKKPAVYWFITNKQISSKQETLEGNQFFKYLSTFNDEEIFEEVNKKCWQKRIDKYQLWDKTEQQLMYHGMTYFKGMEPKDVSILSFDIETDGLVHHKNSEVYIISNTYRDSSGNLVRHSFCLDEYETQADMLNDWVSFVQHYDPSIILNHNIYMYDIPYLAHVAKLHGVKLNLGRDGSEISFSNRPSSFRKDGSQSYEFFKCRIFGREIVDTLFLSIQYDIDRKFPSYGLKPIIKHLKMEKEDRTFIDAGKMKEIFNNRHTNPELWEKAKLYADDDSEDPIKLFDLMIPTTFYRSQSVSKTFQELNVTASGTQLNNMMVRSYLQIGHSIAKASEAQKYQGAISYGIPGIYKNCFKQDVSALYPSIIRQYRIYNKTKDPFGHLLKLVDTFTLSRLKNKELAKSTGLKYYSDMEQAEKPVINSFYGFLGATGLNYNCPESAALITQYGREIITKATIFATGKPVEHWDKRLSEDEDLEDEEL